MPGSHEMVLGDYRLGHDVWGIGWLDLVYIGTRGPGIALDDVLFPSGTLYMLRLCYTV